MTDPKPIDPADPADTADPAGSAGSSADPVGLTADPVKPVFTKEPQPDLPLELRKEKAGWNKNRFAIWILVGGIAIFLIVEGIVGILTKAR